MKLKKKDLLSLRDLSSQEIQAILNLSSALKQKKLSGLRDTVLQGRMFVLIFEKDSTRTRCACEVAAFDEGAGTTILTNSHFGKKESLEDTAKVLSRFYDGIMFRGYAQATVEELAVHASVPVWNGLSDECHPTQVLADLLTIRECLSKDFSQINLLYVGDARNNTAQSLMIASAKMGMNLSLLSPSVLFPPKELMDEVMQMAGETGAQVQCTENIDKLTSTADVIYTDVWMSMGEEVQFPERISLLQAYRVTMSMIQKVGTKDTIFLHCLPAFHDLNTLTAQEIEGRFSLREMEVSDDVFRSSYSKVFDQAENRLHTIKAVMIASINGIEDIYFPIQ